MSLLPSTATAPKAFCDLLNYGVLIDTGLVLCKDGMLLAGIEFVGTDTDSMDDNQLNIVSHMMNQRFKLLGQGWCLHVEAIRRQVTGYPDASTQHFPDPVSLLIDEERRAHYEQQGDHYATSYYLILTYLPPSLMKSKLEQKVYSGGDEQVTEMDRTVKVFGDAFFGFIQGMKEHSGVKQLSGYKIESESGEIEQYDALVDLLHELITGNRQRVRLGGSLIFLDSVLGRVDVEGGLEPIVDDKHLRVIGMDVLPESTYPGMLRVLNSLPIPYRWSGRFIYLGNELAKSEIDKYRRKWKQKEISMIDALFNKANPKVDADAQRMTDDADDAIAKVSGDEHTFGYFNGAVILMHENAGWVEEAVNKMLAVLRGAGFLGRNEKLNCMPAWLGSLPGHPYENLRRPLINTKNLVHLLPLARGFNGHENHPSPQYPLNSSSLMTVSTGGGDIFRLNLFVADLGHTLILGPTGAGKSTLLGALAVQFLRYPNAQVFMFDKGYSVHCLTHALGGEHYDIGSEGSSLVLSPLQELDNEEDRAWASGWVESCCQLQLGHELTPDQRNLIHEMIMTLSHDKKEARSLTVACAQIQDKTLRDALHRYTLDGSMGRLLDGQSDPLKISRFVCFEMESLMRLKETDLLPVLMYLFRRVEKTLKGAPTLVVIDEAWTVMQHPVFREKLISWLRTMRKDNTAVILATQSASDPFKAGMLDTLLDATASRIYLPNPAAQTNTGRVPYENMGLNSAQIGLISGAKQKREYYICNGDGDKLFDLELGNLSLAFVGQSGQVKMKKVNECMAEYGSNWVSAWLEQLGLSSEAAKCGFQEKVDA